MNKEEKKFFKKEKKVLRLRQQYLSNGAKRKELAALKTGQHHIWWVLIPTNTVWYSHHVFKPNEYLQWKLDSVSEPCMKW